MLIQFLILLTMNNSSDTLLLPVSQGRIENSSKNVKGFHEPLEVVVYPTNSFEVMSVSSGRIFNVRSAPDDRYVIMVQSDSLFFSYILDSVHVKKGQQIERSQLIGTLKKESEVINANPLILMVAKGENLLKPDRFLVFKRQ